MKLILKKIVESIPYFIGSKLVKVPFKYRLGGEYNKFIEKIKFSEKLSLEQEKMK